MMLCRALIKTHHMTSRKKIMAITKAAKRYDCAVFIKTGHPPGVMNGECDGAGGDERLEGCGLECEGWHYSPFRCLVRNTTALWHIRPLEKIVPSFRRNCCTLFGSLLT